MRDWGVPDRKRTIANSGLGRCIDKQKPQEMEKEGCKALESNCILM